MQIAKKLLNVLTSKLNDVKTWHRCADIDSFVEKEYGDYLIRGATHSDLDELQGIYSKLNHRSLSRSHIFMLKSSPKKMVLLAEYKSEDSKRVVGFELFYLNKRDFEENTVHEGFIGVMPEHEGKGIATAMRRHSIEHFRNAGFRGISTRISKANVGSLRSAGKLNFKPVEEYFDKSTKELRYYLINRFENDVD